MKHYVPYSVQYLLGRCILNIFLHGIKLASLVHAKLAITEADLVIEAKKIILLE